MITITYSAARKELAKTIKNVLDNREPITISKKEEKVIMMPLEDWNAWQETFTILSNPHMAQNWNKALKNSTTTAISFGSLRKTSNLRNNDYWIQFPSLGRLSLLAKGRQGGSQTAQPSY